MATSTLDVMLPEFARHIGAYLGSFTTTSNISGTSVVSTALRSRFPKDDRLIDFFIRFTSGDNDGEVRLIQDYTASSGTITVEGENLANEAASTTFELYRYDPDFLVNALNDGARRAFPVLYKEVNDRSLTYRSYQNLYTRPSSILQGYVRQVFWEPRVEAKTFPQNIIRDSSNVIKGVDFEGDLTDWTATNATLSAQSESTSPDSFMVFSGQQSGKVLVDSSAVGSVLVAIASPAQYQGQELNFTIWVYSKTASRVTAVIYEDGSRAVASTAHGGGGWERLEVSNTVSQGITTLSVGIEVSSGAQFTCWIDEAIAVAGQSAPQGHQQAGVFWWDEEGDNIRFLQPVYDQGQLLVRGMGLLSSVSSGTDTMEVDSIQRQLLYEFAAAEFFTGDIDSVADSEQNAALKRVTHFRNRAEEAVGSMASIPLLKWTA